MGDRWIRWPQVHEKTGLSRSLVYRLMRAGQFPKNVRASKNCAVWVEREIDEWMTARQQEGAVIPDGGTRRVRALRAAP